MADPKVQIRRSAVPGKVPSTSQLDLGELAINTHDGKAYFKKDVSGAETIVEVGASDVRLTECKILDDISNEFDGIKTGFTISSNSLKFLNTEVNTAGRLLISLGGVVQAPDPTQSAGFYISGGTDSVGDPIRINFVEAPKAGQQFFGIAFGLNSPPEQAGVSEELAIAYSLVLG
jgi:hypothetical protein